MKLESKFIYAKTKAAFQRELPNIPENLKPIVFIEDTKEMWVLGQYFSMKSPGVTVAQDDSTITVSIGDEDFKMTTSGESLSVKKGIGNNIVFSSTALSSIDTTFPLKWDPITKKLTHQESNTTPGNYGESISSEGVSVIEIPYFTVDKFGHIIKAENTTVKIRDYVEQVPSTSLEGSRNVLLGAGTSAASETGVVVKADGMTFNPADKKLTIQGGINAGTTNISGDLTVVGGQIIGDVKGNITGVATPKIHLSTKPEYGGASKFLYGHVILQDSLGITAPAPSSDATDENSSEITRGVAASPLMVWETKTALQAGIDAIPKIDTIKINDYNVLVKELGGVLALNTSGGMQVGVNPITKEIVLKTVEVAGYDANNKYIKIENKLEFTEDFEFLEDKLSIRWKEI